MQGKIERRKIVREREREGERETESEARGMLGVDALRYFFLLVKYEVSIGTRPSTTAGSERKCILRYLFRKALSCLLVKYVYNKQVWVSMHMRTRVFT